MYDPSTYEKNKSIPDSLNLVYVPKLINAMSWNFTKGNILDYGCGTGSTGYKIILPTVESTDSQMYSTDISETMLTFARETFPHPRIHYGAAGSLPDDFPFDKSLLFDKIFSVNVFNFVPDVKTMLASMYDILKPGGELGFTSATVNCTPIKIWKELAKTEKWGPYMKDYVKVWPIWSDCRKEDSKQYFKDIFLKNTGFEEVLFEYTKARLSKPADALLDTMVSANPCLPDIPRELHGKLKEDYRTICAEMEGTPVDSSEITLDFEYICAVLRKPE